MICIELFCLVLRKFFCYDGTKKISDQLLSPHWRRGGESLDNTCSDMPESNQIRVYT